jgi:hypothetical protein
MPVEAGNQAIKDGTLGAVMQRAAERWKPEAMYFTTFDGERTAFMVFDLQDASGIPPFAEPFFRELNASVQLVPAMNGDDLQKGLSQLRGSAREVPSRNQVAAGSTAFMNWPESEKPMMASRSGSMRSSAPTRTATARALLSNGSQCQ